MHRVTQSFVNLCVFFVLFVFMDFYSQNNQTTQHRPKDRKVWQAHRMYGSSLSTEKIRLHGRFSKEMHRVTQSFVNLSVFFVLFVFMDFYSQNNQTTQHRQSIERTFISFRTTTLSVHTSLNMSDLFYTSIKQSHFFYSIQNTNDNEVQINYPTVTHLECHNILLSTK
jgi:preprotein translocase subunit YajC